MIWAKGWQLQNGKYTIRQQLGTGGFGITYRVRDKSGKQFVVKTLNDTAQNLPNFAKFQQDFLNESVRLAKCSHPSIVQVYEVIQEGKLWCIVMEYIDGEDLSSKVIRKGKLSEKDALDYIIQIGNALSYIHNLNPPILHRDLKPHNIMVRRKTSQAILIDFGTSREFIPNLMGAYTPLLTDGFAPIEQYDKYSKLGAYTDVYALAATLYSLVTAQVPIPAPARNILPFVEPQKLNPTISNNLNQAILTGMSLKSEDRPQSMKKWLSLLGANIQTDYSKLESLLKTNKWLEADQETWKLMLKIAHREKEKWLDTSHLNSFPLQDLFEIDRLWTKYSNGHFGFSVQKQIWESIGGNYFASDDTWKKFCYLVGWRKNRNWIPYENLYRPPRTQSSAGADVPC
jgi:serine/threonine protein kinase